MEEENNTNEPETESSKHSEYKLKRASNIKENLSMLSPLGLVSPAICTTSALDVCNFIKA